MRRLAPSAGALAVTAGLLVIALGSGGGLLLLAGGALAVLVVLGRTRLRRRRPTPDPGWAPPASLAFVSSHGHAPAPPSRVAAALARVEARELASTPTFGVGLGFCLMVLVLFGIVFEDDYDGELVGLMELYPIFVHPLVGMTVVAAFWGRTRSVRERTQELFDSCPTSQATRTVAHLRTAWVPAAVTIVTLVLLSATVASQATAIIGQLGARQVALVVGAGVLGVGGVVLGVALARWAPWTPVPIVVVFLIGVVSIQLATAGDRSSVGVRQLSTWLGETTVDVRFTAPHWLAHHVWIVALVALVTVIALLRDARPRPLLPVAAVVVAVAVVAGVLATRPISSGDAARIADLLANPAAHQSCRTAGIPICTYDGDESLAARLAPHVAAVTAAVPAGVLDGRLLRQGARFEGDNRDDLDPAIERRLPAEGDPAVIPVQLRLHEDAIQGLRFWLGLTAVGIVDDLEPGRRPSVAGQARGVVAIWLATRGLDAPTATRMATTGAPASDDGSNGDRPWPDTCYAGLPPVRWSEGDLAAARRLLAAPAEQVQAALASQWGFVTDAATTTDQLLVALHLDPVRSDSRLTPRGTAC